MFVFAIGINICQSSSNKSDSTSDISDSFECKIIDGGSNYNGQHWNQLIVHNKSQFNFININIKLTAFDQEKCIIGYQYFHIKTLNSNEKTTKDILLQRSDGTLVAAVLGPEVPNKPGFCFYITDPKKEPISSMLVTVEKL